jgi:hypothetical protein
MRRECFPLPGVASNRHDNSGLRDGAMKFLRDNFAYILLALIAIVLIYVTLSLQVAILSTQSSGEAQSGRTIFYLFRQQLAELISPPTDTPTTVAAPTPTAVPLPSNTPIVIVVQPTPFPPTATTAPLAPTSTATFPPLPTQTETPALAFVAPSATPALPTMAPTATLPAPTATPIGEVDFRLGYVDRNRDCTAMTELMQLVLERKFNLRIAAVAFPDAASLFAKLAAKSEAERVDLSFCYMDPTDRSYLQKYFGFIIFIGSGYRQVGDQKFIIMSNAAVKSPIERGNPCLYRFFTSLNLSTTDFGTENMTTWYENNASLIDGWVRCE